MGSVSSVTFEDNQGNKYKAAASGEASNISIEELDFIAINIGPGSFTGIRIGVSFAKGLSFAKNIPLIPINGFDIINNKIKPKEKSFYICIFSHKSY